MSSSRNAVDTDYLIRRAMTKGYQILSLLTPPAYLCWAFTSKKKSPSVAINNFFRATWAGGALGQL
jgi:hypothetical protein